MSDVLAVICVTVWVYLVFARGGFWLGPVRDRGSTPPPRRWPRVVAVIPARNEAELIAASVTSLLRQDYPGSLSIVVVDDDSSDGTAAAVTALTAGVKPDCRVTLVRSRGLPVGWTGKLWALNQGIAAANVEQPEYLLLTDADIVHAPDLLAWLVAQSSAGGFVLTSLMAELRCRSLAERSHVPAFVYFFQMLFPFSWVGLPDAKTAAAGGCMLVRADALRNIGGIESIRAALIDDCALAAKLKAVGPIWLGLTERVRSVRPYATFVDVEGMVSRSAYAQLGYSPLLLAATVGGMALVFAAAPLLAVFASSMAQYLGLAVWLTMALTLQPMLRFYRVSPFWGLALPIVASLYAFYTLDSAYRHFRRRGGQWKGRVHLASSPR
jgi:hopene-associated glycosyltransferase HpnB